jgi:hypothetical protein
MKQLTYISGSTVILAGSSVMVALPTVPHKAKEIVIGAETGAVYFDINLGASGSATANSFGYVPAGIVYTIPNVYNVNTLHLFGTGKAHILYFAP